MRRELDPLQERLRQQHYKELADKALTVLGQIKEKTHEAYYLLAHCYHNKWDYESASKMIETAIRQCKRDPLFYTSYVALRKTIGVQHGRRRPE
jgi:tetratricopeptide (TPR) repeat protein